MRIQHIALFAVLLLLACPARAFDREDYEEEAGGSFAVLINPEDSIYGIGFGTGTWLKNAPVFGDYFLRLFNNDIQKCLYSAAGMTIRLMPRWKFAPFVGGGGSYNFALSSSSDEDDRDSDDSYGAGHAEAGFRVWLDNEWRLFEIAVSQNWTTSEGDSDYWLLAISVGTGI